MLEDAKQNCLVFLIDSTRLHNCLKWAGWYTMTNAVFQDACASLQSEFFDKTPALYNFLNFEVAIHPTNGGGWMAARKGISKEAYADQLNAPLHLSMRIEFLYHYFGNGVESAGK